MERSLLTGSKRSLFFPPLSGGCHRGAKLQGKNRKVRRSRLLTLLVPWGCGWERLKFLSRSVTFHFTFLSFHSGFLFGSKISISPLPTGGILRALSFLSPISKVLGCCHASLQQKVNSYFFQSPFLHYAWTDSWRMVQSISHPTKGAQSATTSSLSALRVKNSDF